jgi:hypothetical protein
MPTFYNYQFAKKGINESFSIREKEKITIKDRKFKVEKMPFYIKSKNSSKSLDNYRRN